MPAVVPGSGPGAAQSARGDCRRDFQKTAGHPLRFPDRAGRGAADTGKCRAIGFSHQKVRALLALARAITRGEWISKSSGREMTPRCSGPARVTWRRPLDSRIRAAQRSGPLPRVPWRRCGRSKRLGRWLGRSRPMDYAGVQRAVKRWMPAWLGVFPPATRWVVPGRRSGLDAQRPITPSASRSDDPSRRVACLAVPHGWRRRRTFRDRHGALRSAVGAVMCS